MSGLSIQEVQELISKAGLPTDRALTVQFAAAVMQQNAMVIDLLQQLLVESRVQSTMQNMAFDVDEELPNLRRDVDKMGEREYS